MIIEKNKLWELLLYALQSMNADFTEHGKRVAYVMLRLCQKNGYTPEKTHRLVFASLFHEIGAFKSEDAKGLLNFEAENTYRHCLEGYLFLKYFSPLGESAAPILYHHAYYRPDDTYENDEAIVDGMKIHLADRFDVLFLQNVNVNTILKELESKEGIMFAPKDMADFKELITKTNCYESLTTNAYHDELRDYFYSLNITDDFVLGTLKMLSFTFEVVSPSTVYHSALTAAYAKLICRELGQSEEACEEAYVAGLLHDIGKIKTPPEILEKPASLTGEETEIIRQHAKNTYDLLLPYFDLRLVRIASRHHEKLDGGGYPDGLTEFDLTENERILGIADVVSALYTKRSYKNAFDADSVKKVLSGMANSGQLDSRLTDLYLQNAEKLNVEAMKMISVVEKQYQAMNEEMEKLKDLKIAY